MTKSKIVFIGSGNVATSMSRVLKKAGHQIIQIVGHTKASSEHLAKKLETACTLDFSSINPNADFYILCVPDQQIANILKKLPLSIQGIILHTAGSVDMSVLSKFKNFGVLYPLQSLQKSRIISFKKIPLLIESNNPKNLEKITHLAHSISEKVEMYSSQDRLNIHIAAVFSNNFVNYLYTLSEELLMPSKQSFDLLRPLIQETANKVQKRSPLQTQTGPAKRQDQITLDKHLKYLEKHPVHQAIYRYLSDQIKTLKPHD